MAELQADHLEIKMKTKVSDIFRHIAKLLSDVTYGREEPPNGKQDWEHYQDERQKQMTGWIHEKKREPCCQLKTIDREL